MASYRHPQPAPPLSVTLDPSRSPPHNAIMLIFKILRADEWADLCAKGETLGAAIDVSDGFIHFSTAGQLAETARKHFANENGLVLLAFDADSLGAALHWEPSRGGELFPHLYGPLRLENLLWHRDMPLGPNGHDIGEI